MADISILVPIVSALGIGLIMKDFVGSAIAFLYLRCFRRGVKVGERIRVGDVKGDVVAITPLKTVVLEIGDGRRLPSTPTGRVVYVPNSFLLFNPVVKYGDNKGKIVDDVKIYVKPSSDVSHARSVLLKIIRERTENDVVAGLPDVDVYYDDDKIELMVKYLVEPHKMTQERTEILCLFLEVAKNDGRIVLKG